MTILLFEKMFLSLLSIILSNYFPAQSSKHRGGLNEDVSFGGLSHFFINANHALFHVFGKCPFSRHLLYNHSKVSGRNWTMILSASFVTPSIPGAVLFLVCQDAIRSSSISILGISSTFTGQYDGGRIGCMGKRLLTMSCKRSFWCAAGGDLTSFPITILHGLPHGSCSTRSYSFFQLTSLACFIAFESSSLDFLHYSCSGILPSSPSLRFFHV